MSKTTEEDRLAELRWLPLVVFGMIYFATFVLGCLLLLSGWRGFEVLFQEITGVYSFFLGPEALLTDLLLTFVAPAMLGVGYWAAARRAEGRLLPGRSARGPNFVTLSLIWASSIVFAGVSLARADAFRHLVSWFNYREWIEARLRLFRTLEFFEFVNLYVVLPVLTALVVLSLWRRPWPKRLRILLIALACVPLAVADVLLFQKRYILLSLLLVASAALLRTRMEPRPSRPSRSAWKYFVLLGAVAYVSYCVLFGMPKIWRQSERMAVRERPPAVLGPPESMAGEEAQPGAGPGLAQPRKAVRLVWRRRVFETALASVLPGRWIGPAPGDDQRPSPGKQRLERFVFALVSPLFRTAPPALAYPVIFPERIPYCGLDLGGDILGWGRMPDDNLRVYPILYNTVQAGATAVPFQFAFYSQVGLSGSLLLSALLGYVLARVWFACLAGTMGIQISAVAGALVVLLCAYLAMDSFRNSLLAGYGVGWGLLFLGILSFLGDRSRPGETTPHD